MISVSSAVGSKELVPIIRGMNVACDKIPMDFGDAAFEGNGPDGNIAVGIERKALHDMLNCIDDSRYAAHQRIGMKQVYNVSILIIEGMWKAKEDGTLMESRDGQNWFPCRPGGKPVRYSKLRRYLISVAYSGVRVNFTRNLWHTAYDIVEEYWYHQKKWDDHTSLLEVQKLAIPQMNTRAGLCLKWAFDLEGLGPKLAPEAAKKFRNKPIKLATAEEQDWLGVPGIGVKQAIKIVKEIHGTS